MFSDFDYTDSVLFGNLVDLIDKDVNQTSGKVQVNKTHTESNPLVAPIVNNTNPDSYKLLSMLGTAILADRWSKQTRSERVPEMLLANIIEAGALHYSGEPWRLQYGISF